MKFSVQYHMTWSRKNDRMPTTHNRQSKGGFGPRNFTQVMCQMPCDIRETSPWVKRCPEGPADSTFSESVIAQVLEFKIPMGNMN